jgi:hypothetical protein
MLGQTTLPGFSLTLPGVGVTPLWGDIGSYGHSALGLAAGVLLPEWGFVAALAGFTIYQFLEFNNFEGGTDSTDTLGETTGDMLEFLTGAIAGYAIRQSMR